MTGFVAHGTRFAPRLGINRGNANVSEPPPSACRLHRLDAGLAVAAGRGFRRRRPPGGEAQARRHRGSAKCLHATGLPSGIAGDGADGRSVATARSGPFVRHRGTQRCGLRQSGCRRSRTERRPRHGSRADGWPSVLRHAEWQQRPPCGSGNGVSTGGAASSRQPRKRLTRAVARQSCSRAPTEPPRPVPCGSGGLPSPDSDPAGTMMRHAYAMTVHSHGGTRQARRRQLRRRAAERHASLYVLGGRPWFARMAAGHRHRGAGRGTVTPTVQFQLVLLAQAVHGDP